MFSKKIPFSDRRQIKIAANNLDTNLWLKKPNVWLFKPLIVFICNVNQRFVTYLSIT